MFILINNGNRIISSAAKMEPELLMRPSKPRTTTTTTEPPVIFNDSIRVAKELEQNRRRGIQVDKFPGSVVWVIVHNM